MMKIKDKFVGLKNEPVIVAEMSGNHNRSLKIALEIVEASANAGVHMLKLQTYTPETITLDVEEGEFVISDPKSLWKNRSLYSLYKEAFTPWEWQKEIMLHANKMGMACFSSVFDESSVDFLESLDVPAYKIASQECIHLPLIQIVASTNKPIVMSTGMASLSEIDEAVNMIRKTGTSEIVLMKCTSSYPANPKNSNVMTIPYLRKIFDCEVGLSDHTLGIGSAVAAVAHGATMIEKHVTLSRADGGVDSSFSLEPQEIKELVEESKRAWQSLGGVFFGPTEAEIPSMTGRRSIYISKDMELGDEIDYQNVRVIRPNCGLHPKYLELVIGRKINQNVQKGTPLSWDLIF